MKIRPLALLLLVCLALPLSVPAFETDQFNLPPAPLADIGDEVSEYVERNVTAAVDDLNAQIERSLSCIEGHAITSCATRGVEQARLGTLRSQDELSKAVFKRLGDGTIFRTRFGKWVNSHEFQNDPSRFKTSFMESIYVAVPANYVTISPTINMFGTEFGSDKLEHFFQQGYRYHTIEAEDLSKGVEPDRAILKAVKWGQKTERTYYGLLVSGVYSNADLYANYVGMKFYDGLTKPVVIDGAERPPLISLENGRWQINEPLTLRDNLVKPFISDHLNEALNPSGYSFIIYPSVRKMVRKNACPDWRKQFPNLTADILEQKARDLELWHDEDYGNMAKGKLVKLSEVCFARTSAPN